MTQKMNQRHMFINKITSVSWNFNCWYFVGIF